MGFNVLYMILDVIQQSILLIFNLDIVPGVSLGWVFIVVVIMFLLIKFFLSGGSDNG